MSIPAAATMFEKIWQAHLVCAETAQTPAVLYIDMHFTHEVSSPAAFSLLQAHALPLRRPDRTLATMDHSTPTQSAGILGQAASPHAAALQVRKLEQNAELFGMELFGMHDPRRGIVHVIGPELGITQPGMTIVCGDSHTSTHGAFGALAFGIGSTEAAHVFATQCLLQRKLKTFEIRADGALQPGVTAKDLILAVILKVGVAGGTGHVFEYRGTTISALSMEQRMTVCNMSIEAGARAGMIAPDDTTFAYIAGRPRAPNQDQISAAIARWKCLATDAHAHFDARVSIDASQIQPMITYGTNPGMAIPINGQIPTRDGDAAYAQALAYMDFHAGESILGKRIDVVFIGSCTNGRIEDLQAAASLLKGRKVAKGVRMLIVPGSQEVKRDAEARGLAAIFIEAGADWRESGCSMCVGMNGDTVGRGQYAVSTSNRNFEGRQGPGARTLLASPLTAAASAVTGKVTDPRNML